MQTVTWCFRREPTVFNSSLALQTIRIGLDYKLGEKTIDPGIFTKTMTALELDRFAFHGQSTFMQYAAPFRSPYLGPQSLAPNQGRESLDFMYFIGAKLWKDAEVWIDPEFNQGFGLSNTKGIAGFPSGASFKVGSDVPYPRLQRFFLRQTIDLGGKTQKVEADQNQFAGSNTTDRLVFTVGKFSISDVFDQNKYAQNPRKDFMNWALIDAGSYDYAADAWGYTYGAAAEWYQGPWTLRAGVFDISTVPTVPILIRPSASSNWMAKSSADTHWESPRQNSCHRLSYPRETGDLPRCDRTRTSNWRAGRHCCRAAVPEQVRP